MSSITSASISCSSRTSPVLIAGKDSLSQVAGRSASVASNAVKFTAQIALSQKNSAPLPDNPRIFFSNFDIDSSSFDSRDVQCLQRLFQTIKFNQITRLFDLIGLRIYDLIEKISIDWCSAERKQAKEDWAAFFWQVFLCFVLENSKESLPYPDPSTQFPLFTPESFNTAFEKFIMGIKTSSKAHNQKLSQQTTSHSKVFQTKKFEFFQKKTAPFLTELDELKAVLQKSLALKNPPEVLSRDSLSRYPGSEHVNPTSQDEACEALQNLCLYLEMLTVAQEVNLQRGWPSLDKTLFSAVLKELLPIKQSKDEKEIALHARKTLIFIHDAVLYMREKEEKQDIDIVPAEKESLDRDSQCCASEEQKKPGKPSKKSLELLLSPRLQDKLTLSWFLDFQKILEKSIIVPLDPSFYISQDYVRRMIKNAREIWDDVDSLFKEHNSELPRPATTEIDRLLKKIKFSCLFLLDKLDFFDQLQTIYIKMYSIHKNFGTSFADPSMTKNVILLLKEFNATALSEVLDLDREACKTEPLSQQLLWLGHLFVLCHDLEVISGIKSETAETEIFPESFLQFLALEQDFLTEENLPPSISIPEDASCESESSSSSQASFYSDDFEKLEGKSESASPIRLESVAVESVSKAKSNLPAQISKSKTKKAGKKKVRDKEKADSSSQSRARAKEEVSSQIETSVDKSSFLRDLLANRKRRHVEKILAHLGLQPIRTTGSHRVWSDPNDTRKWTVVPHHSEIDFGTLKAIGNQLLEKGWSPN